MIGCSARFFPPLPDGCSTSHFEAFTLRVAGAVKSPFLPKSCNAAPKTILRKHPTSVAWLPGTFPAAEILRFHAREKPEWIKQSLRRARELLFCAEQRLRETFRFLIGT